MNLKKHNITILPDHTRVLLRPLNVPDDRMNRIVNSILALDEQQADKIYSNVLLEFKHRHRSLEVFLLNRFSTLNIKNKLSDTQKKLIASYFTMEYSVEAAALFNPSIIWHPDQNNLNAGEKRFIISLRAAGEGHISSIVFRIGTIDSQNNISMSDQLRFTTGPSEYSGIDENYNYEMSFSTDTFIDERIIFPHSPAESNGIEDARFVEFRDKNEITYYATYTAYNGRETFPQLIETKDFAHFKVNTLSGSEVKNKGFALFPFKINNSYAMISRQDAENIFIMYSDDLYKWNSKQELVKPKYPWELLQLGNCGSPIETPEGWLLLTHGVGHMRKYSISAVLLDRNDPSRVIGRLSEPLLSPDEKEREGYVPNVVYSCGGILNNNTLIIPYAMSDRASAFASIELKELFNNMI